MSDEPGATIRRAIEDHGPISFAEFMELALYGPGGFYERPPVGAEGHFITSPHAHPAFARMLAGGLRRSWEALGRPEPFPIVEVGAGDGTLARQLLEALDELPVIYAAVDRSTGALETLRSMERALPLRAYRSIGEVGPVERGAVVANELLDNLPFHRVRGGPGGPVELRVGLDAGGRPVEVEAPCEPALAAAAPPRLAPGEEAVVSLEAQAFVDRVAELLAHGLVLLIDYEAVAGLGADAVHGYRNQRVIADVLEAPGSADITAGVDLTAVARRAKERGLRVHGPVSQADALAALGYETWATAELSRQGELLRTGAGVEAVRIWSERRRAALLVDPAGLGRLRWLILRTPEATAPAWVEEMEARDEPRS